MKEFCICAAILTAEGKVIRGHRHDDCIKTAIKMGLHAVSNVDYQGFMTSTNRFVGREEAMRLQREANMMSAYSPDGKLYGNILFSEDLY